MRGGKSRGRTRMEGGRGGGETTRGAGRGGEKGAVRRHNPRYV